MRNLHLTFDYSKVEISQNFVAFSEYMNFTKISVTSNERLRLAELRINKQDQRFLEMGMAENKQGQFRIRKKKIKAAH